MISSFDDIFIHERMYCANQMLTQFLYVKEKHDPNVQKSSFCYVLKCDT